MAAAGRDTDSSTSEGTQIENVQQQWRPFTWDEVEGGPLIEIGSLEQVRLFVIEF